VDVGPIHLTTAAEERLRGGIERLRQTKPTMIVVLIEHGDVGIEAPPLRTKKTRSSKVAMIRFSGPWLALCGYEHKREVKGWIPICLLGEEVFLLPSLIKRLRSYLIDQRVVCDPVTGLSHTGLYLRKQ
jgi:hypothetical protein